jgi:hypothetical protein
VCCRRASKIEIASPGAVGLTRRRICGCGTAEQSVPLQLDQNVALRASGVAVGNYTVLAVAQCQCRAA